MSEKDSRPDAKEALLEAAGRLFTENGYDAVSTRELAEAAGVNLGAIQYHFGSKAKLFVETVYRLMKNTGPDCQGFSEPVTCRVLAAVRLCEFVVRFLSFYLGNRERHPCRVMFREILGAPAHDPEMYEALTTTVVRDFIAPLDTLLRPLIRTLNPELDEQGLSYAVQSIVGQCSFYFTHGPFIAQLRGVGVADADYLDAAARHISAFSLRGLGCAEAEVREALHTVWEEGRKSG